jgi:hypothetical protein
MIFIFGMDTDAIAFVGQAKRAEERRYKAKVANSSFV